MLNKIILFLWKIRVCLLCFAMFELGHSTWCGPAGDGTGRSRISGRRGVRGAGGFWGAGGNGGFLGAGSSVDLGVQSPAATTSPLPLVPEGAQGAITRVTRDIYLF